METRRESEQSWRVGLTSTHDWVIPKTRYCWRESNDLSPTSSLKNVILHFALNCTDVPRAEKRNPRKEGTNHPVVQ